MADQVEVVSRPVLVPSKPGVPVKPTLGAKTLGFVSTSLGGPVIDGAAGAAVGYFLAPGSKRTGYAIGGGIATGLFGVLGLVGTLVYRAFDKG